MTLPTDRTTANTPAEHVSDHNTLHGQFNEIEAAGGVSALVNPAVAAQMALSSTQTGLSNSADDKIDFDTEVFDTDGSLVNIANSRFEIQETGYYLVIGVWHWEDPPPQNDGYMAVYVNGSGGVFPLARGFAIPNFGGRELVGFGSLTAADTVELYVNTGGASNVEARGGASAELRTTFSIVRLI